MTNSKNTHVIFIVTSLYTYNTIDMTNTKPLFSVMVIKWSKSNIFDLRFEMK